MIRYPAMILAACVALLSSYLTYAFTKDIGASLGFPVAMGLIGLCLEGAKALFPIYAVMMYKANKYFKAGIFALITGIIMVVSFSASMATLSNGTDKAGSNSDEYKAITAQIERLEQAIKSDLDNGYRTRAIETEDKVAELVSQRSAIKNNSFVGEYGYYVSIVISVLIEVVGCLLMVMSASTQNKQDRGVFTGNKPKITHEPAVLQLEKQETKQINFVASESVEEQIRTAIITKQVERPSVSCLRANGYKGISSSAMSKIIAELGAAGFLEPRGNRGWKYA